MTRRKTHPPRLETQKNKPHQKDARAHSRTLSAGGADWLYGIHAGLAAIENPARRIERVIATDEARRSLGARLESALAIARIKTPGLGIEGADRQTITAMLPAGAVHQGLLIKAAPLPQPDLWQACEPQEGEGRALVVVLDQVTDPHNVGAILRSAAAFNARAIVMPDAHAPDATGTLAKAASGALETVPLVRVANLARAMDELAEMGYWRIGLAGDAERSLADAAQGMGRAALVLGAEGEGMRRLTRERCDLLARLPINPRIESLNVSNAAAIAMYELMARG